MIISASVRRRVYEALLSLLLAPAAAYADWTLNLTPGVTPFSKTVYNLHMLILGICFVIALGVFGAIFYSLIKFRKSRGAVPAKWFHSTLAEIIWTVIPILILIIMAVPATRALILMEDNVNSEMTIKVTGYQWRWGYEYLDQGISFISALHPASNAARQRGSGIDLNTVENYLLDVDNYVVIPTRTKIRILTTAADVIHSWWVPALGWKRDAIPGFITESWIYVEQPGIYRGQCAELCGKDHGYMPIVVQAVSPEEFQRWVDEQKAAANEVVDEAVDFQLIAHDSAD